MSKLTNKRVDKGVVQFAKSDFSDKHIKDVLNHIVGNVPGISIQDLTDKIQKKLDEFKTVLAKAPLLYSTIAQNLIEGEVFNLLKEHKVPVTKSTKFNKQTFDKLVQVIKHEHPKFFPMRSFYDHKTLFAPRFIFVPGIDKKFDGVDTAAATPAGEFIFNTEFMQQLMDYAHLKNIKPKSKKYSNNGGPFPPEWAYVEFVIIHEFLHYTQSDFKYQKLLKANPKIINWVGDFRSNYELVKSGLEQLPIGLHNDSINRDRQVTYREMYELVKSEFDKLKSDEQKAVEDLLDELSDDHGPGSGGEGEEGEGEEGEGEEGEGAGSGAGDKKGKGKGKGSGSDKSEDEIWDEIDEASKEVEDTINKAGEEKEQDADASKKKGKAGNGPGSSIDKNGGRGGMGGRDHEFDYRAVQPRLSWEKILRNLITSSDISEYETYQKVNKRNATGMAIGAETGVTTVKPGIKITPVNKMKLVFVVDESGSMYSSIVKCYANIVNLFNKNKELQDVSFGLLKFSSDYHTYIGNFKRKKAFKVDSPKELVKIDRSSFGKPGISLDEAFTKANSGATNFTAELKNDLLKLANEGYNILIFSDTDIINDSANFKEFESLFKMIKQRLYVLFDSEYSYQEAVKKLHNNYKNFSYIESGGHD